MRASAKRDLVASLAALLPVTTTSILGQIATYPNLTPWYASLEKPPFNPPNWVFAPVWISLYLLMAFAFWKILRLPPSSQRRNVVFVFMLMLVLNAAWSWMFFAAHSPALGLVNIVLQLALIVSVIPAFYRLDRMAAWCLVPLAAWVAFALLLNFSIWRLNT